MPSRSDGSSRHGMHSAPARRYSASRSSGPIAPGSCDVDARGGDLAPQRLAVLVVLADDQRVERDAARLQQRARVDHHVEALLGHEPADAEDAQAAVAARRILAAREQGA